MEILKDFVEYKGRFYEYNTTLDSFYFRGLEKDCGRLPDPQVLYPLYFGCKGSVPYANAFIIPTMHDKEAYFASLGKRTRKNIRQLRRDFPNIRIREFKPSRRQFRDFANKYVQYTNELHDYETAHDEYDYEYDDDTKQFIDYWMGQPELRCIKVYSGTWLLYTAFTIPLTENAISIPLVLRNADDVGKLGLFEVVHYLADNHRYVDLCETFSSYKRHLGAHRYQCYLYCQGTDVFRRIIDYTILRQARKELTEEELSLPVLHTLE